MRHIYPLNRRHVFIPLMLFVALAVGFLLLFPGGFAQAQDASNIPYQENGTGPVTTFTATDPEGGTIYWSLVLSEGFDPIDVNGNDIASDAVDIAAADVADDDDFSISAGGVLTFNISPDYEEGRDSTDTIADNEYKIVVVASDDAPGAGTEASPTEMAYKKVTIMVTDVPEPGIVTLSSLQPQVGAPLTADLADPEVAEAKRTGDEVTWKWEKSQDMSSWTPIDSVDLAVRTPDATTVGYYLRATATYDDEKRTAQAVSVNKVRAKPTTTDAMATFPAAATTRMVAENSPAGTNVGDPVKANDTADEVLTYSLTGAIEAGFQINPATGQITVGPRTILDADVTASYTVMVTATEAGGRSASPLLTNPVEVTITVDNVNEAPSVDAGATMVEIPENTAITVAIVTYTATDVDEDDAVTLSLEGADADKFSIDTSTANTLTFDFKVAPNYEMPADAGRNNVYNVTVVATDDATGVGGKMTAKRAVTIMVTNEPEAGTVTLSAQQPQVGIPITASVDDPDGGVTDITWQWYDAAFAVDNNTDEVDEARIDENDNTIAGATSATYTPTAADATNTLGVLASYKDGKGNDKAAGNAAAAVIVKTDNAPTFGDAESGKRFIEENQDAGSPSGREP